MDINYNVEKVWEKYVNFSCTVLSLLGPVISRDNRLGFDTDKKQSFRCFVFQHRRT